MDGGPAHHSHHSHHAHDDGAVVRRVLNRRMFMTELGRRTFAVTILGGLFVACSNDDNTSAPASSSTSTQPDDVDPTTSTTDAARPRLEWRRVELGFVSAYVLVRGREAAVVDTGTPGSEAMIGQALGDLGVGWGGVDHVVLTHFHNDHAGSIGAVLGSAENATGYAGEADIGSIETSQTLRAVGDGDEVFGLQVIATPGHTAGHISVLDVETGLLVAGDALRREGAEVSGSPPQFTADATQADASVQKLAALRFDTLLPGHGDPLEGSAGEAVAAYAATL